MFKSSLYWLISNWTRPESLIFGWWRNINLRSQKHNIFIQNSLTQLKRSLWDANSNRNTERGSCSQKSIKQKCLVLYRISHQRYSLDCVQHVTYIEAVRDRTYVFRAKNSYKQKYGETFRTSQFIPNFTDCILHAFSNAL